MATPADIPVRKRYDFKRPPELDGQSVRHPFVVVGGGPIGLSMALDLAKKGHKVVVLNKMDILADGSKALCFSKRSLDIWDRIGVGEPMTNLGVQWNVGKVFWQDREDPIFQFDLLPVKNQKNPAFINLQQFHAEDFLIQAVEANDLIDLRWNNEVTAIETIENGRRLSVDTPEGTYALDADWVIACDGNRSPLRTMLGLDFEGRVFEDNFLIADVRFKLERPSERWFWFDPPFPGASALMHKQPDGVWRLDFQLGWDIDKAEAMKPENVEPFVKGFLGGDIDFEYEWVSVYTFQCRRMDQFVHDRVIFAGDSAHLVSPFGARGANGGLADIDNLGWKLDLIARGKADQSLLETYEYEAGVTADENILNSTRATDFLTPKNAGAETLRDAVLKLATQFEWARPYVNSGRLSAPVHYPNSTLSIGDADAFDGGVAPGSPCLDAPTDKGWLLSMLGDAFKLLRFVGEGESPAPIGTLSEVVIEISGDNQLAAERYGAKPGSAYLVRPDQYVMARWHDMSTAKLDSALSKVFSSKEIAA